MLRRMTPLLVVVLLHAQEKPARLTFEVASIKPFKPDAGGRGAGGMRTRRHRRLSLSFLFLFRLAGGRCCTRFRATMSILAHCQRQFPPVRSAIKWPFG